MQKYQLGRVVICPFSLITIEDLEIVIPYLKQVRLTEVLDHYIQRIEPVQMFKGVFRRFVRKKQLRKPETDITLTRLAKIIDEMESVFHTID